MNTLRQKLKPVTMRMSVFVAALLSVAVLVAPTAFADATSECTGAGYTTGNLQAACLSGYGGTQCTTATFSGGQLTACQKGAELAQTANQNQNGNQNGNNNQQNSGNTQGQGDTKCGGAKTEFISCNEDAGIGAIGTLIRYAVIGLTILIGIVAVGGITYAAILYASSRDNAAQTQQAIGIIRNIVIGLAMYGFTVAIINWLIPGGVIG
jgi:hypothetical protein